MQFVMQFVYWFSSNLRTFFLETKGPMPEKREN